MEFMSENDGDHIDWFQHHRKLVNRTQNPFSFAVKIRKKFNSENTLYDFSLRGL